MNIQPGTRVLILEDCRDGGNTAPGTEATYEGDFSPPGEEWLAGNPRLRLDNGKVIWGYQCWWGPMESEKTLEEKLDSLQGCKAWCHGVWTGLSETLSQKEFDELLLKAANCEAE